jgi:hypothetical protein
VHGLAEPGAREGFHRQVLHRDRLAFTDQAGGEPVVELAAGVGDLRVRTGHLQTGLLPVLRPLLLAGQLPLRLLQLLLRPAQKPRGVDLRPVRQDREMGQARIDPHRRQTIGIRHPRQVGVRVALAHPNARASATR